MIDSRDIDVVAFDCDGVMFDSSQANHAYYNQVLAHVGLPDMSAEQFAYAHMHTVDESLAFLIRDSDLLAVARQYRQEMSYVSLIGYMVIEPTLKPLLTKLKPGYKTAIATNRTDTMDRVLTEHDLEGQFDLVITASDVSYPKPHPEQLVRIMGHFGIDPRQMVYIGDSLLDAQAAQAAAVPFIAYRNPDLSADMHIESLQQIEALLDI